MNKRFSIICFSFILIFSGWVKHSLAQPFLDPGIGFLHGKPGSAIRLNVGINNILLHRFGAYTTMEFVLKSNMKVPVRDIFGASLRLTQNFAVHGGVGIINKGILSKEHFRGARKEIGISRTFPKLNIDVDLAYSFTLGQSVNVGYVIPVRSAYFKPHGPPQEYEFPLTETYAQVDRDILRSLLGNITFSYGIGVGKKISGPGTEGLGLFARPSVVPSNFLATYNFNQLRVGGGLYADAYSGGKVTTKSLLSRMKLYAYAGYDFAAFSNYSFTGDMQIGWLEKSQDFVKTLPSYVNAGVTARYSFVNYFSVFARPTIEVRTSPNKGLTAYISAGVSVGLPGIAKCNIPSCDVQVDHGHGSREFRRNKQLRNVPGNKFGGSAKPSRVKVKRVKPGK